MNLTGVTYSFSSFGVRIRTLYGLLPFCTIPKERITRLYTHKASMNFLDSLGRAYSGWQLGNRFSRTALVIETDMFFFRRLYLTPEDPEAVIALLSDGRHVPTSARPGLTTRSSERRGGVHRSLSRPSSRRR